MDLFLNDYENKTALLTVKFIEIHRADKGCLVLFSGMFGIFLFIFSHIKIIIIRTKQNSQVNRPILLLSSLIILFK